VGLSAACSRCCSRSTPPPVLGWSARPHRRFPSLRRRLDGDSTGAVAAHRPGRHHQRLQRDRALVNGASRSARGGGYVPYAGYFGSQINIAYNTGEPLVQSWVYSFAYLIDGNVSLIGPTWSTASSRASPIWCRVRSSDPGLPAAVAADPAVRSVRPGGSRRTRSRLRSPRDRVAAHRQPRHALRTGSSPRSRMPWLRSPMPSRARRRRLSIPPTSHPTRRTRHDRRHRHPKTGAPDAQGGEGRGELGAGHRQEGAAAAGSRAITVRTSGRARHGRIAADSGRRRVGRAAIPAAVP